MAFDDEMILFALRADGFTVQEWKLQEARLSMGMIRSVDRTNFDMSNNRLPAFASQKISQYGRQYLYQ